MFYTHPGSYPAVKCRLHPDRFSLCPFRQQAPGHTNRQMLNLYFTLHVKLPDRPAFNPRQQIGLLIVQNYPAIHFIFHLETQGPEYWPSVAPAIRPCPVFCVDTITCIPNARAKTENVCKILMCGNPHFLSSFIMRQLGR